MRISSIFSFSSMSRFSSLFAFFSSEIVSFSSSDIRLKLSPSRSISLPAFSVYLASKSRFAMRCESSVSVTIGFVRRLEKKEMKTSAISTTAAPTTR